MVLHGIVWYCCQNLCTKMDMSDMWCDKPRGAQSTSRGLEKGCRLRSVANDVFNELYFLHVFYMFLHVGAKPHVHPHPKNTQTQYRILVIRGAMKTLAVRRDFDWCFVDSGFRVLGF